MANQKTSDLHGNAPDNSPVALLLIDVINDFEFDAGAADLFRHALPAAKRIAALKEHTSNAGDGNERQKYDDRGHGRSDQRLRDLAQRAPHGLAALLARIAM